MKNTKRLLSALLALCMVFGILCTGGGVLCAQAEPAETDPSQPIHLDFNEDPIGELPEGWEVHPVTQKADPDAAYLKVVEDQEDPSNRVLMLDQEMSMASGTGYYARYAFEETESAILSYRFKCEVDCTGAVLPTFLYSGIDNAMEARGTPLMLSIKRTDTISYKYFSIQANFKDLVARDLYPEQWYELTMVVNLKEDTCALYLDGKELNLDVITDKDPYPDKTGMTLDRVSVGAYFSNQPKIAVDDMTIYRSAYASEVSFAQTDYTVRVNQSLALRPQFAPAVAKPCEMTYASSDPSVLTVDENGVMTGVNIGTATVTAAPAMESVTPVVLNVTVDEEMTGTFTGVPETLELPVGGHLLLEHKLELDFDGATATQWISSDESVVTMDEWGEIYAVAEGQAEITISSVDYATVQKKIAVTVKKADVTKTIYVSPDGTGDGSGEDAPTTLEGALAILEGIDKTNMTGNVEVILADGYYYRTEALALNENHGGNNLYSVVFKAAEGANPTIGGAMHIAGTEFAESEIEGVYVADVPAGTATRQVYVDNIRATRARSTGNLIDPVFLMEESTKIGITCQNTELLDITNPEDLEIVYITLWAHQRVSVEEIRADEKGKVQLIMEQPGWGYATIGEINMDIRMDMIKWYENALILLDEPGEWYLDDTANKLYYMPREFEDMSQATVTLAALDVWDEDGDEKEGLVTVHGSDFDNPVQNIRFQGITFADATWLRPSSGEGHSCLQSNYIRDGGCGATDENADAAVSVRRANGIDFTGCTFTRIGTTALKLTDATRNSMTVGNHFFDISGIAIQVGEPDWCRDVNNHNPTEIKRIGKNCDIINNYIHDIGIDYQSSSAISITFYADIDVLHNEIFRIPYTGIHIGLGWGNRFPTVLKNMNICDNLVHDAIFNDVADCGTFYTTGNTAGNMVLSGNYFVNQGDRVAAIYFDSGASGWVAENNVADPVNVYWLHTAVSSRNLLVRNNYHRNSPDSSGTDNVVVENNIQEAADQWSEGAQKIIDNAGLEAEYENLRNNQAARLFSNLTKMPITGRTAVQKVELDQKQTFQLEVTSTDGKGAPVDLEGVLSYFVDDESVATVSDTGLITGLKAGTTGLRIHVISNNIHKTIKTEITVSDQEYVEPTTEPPEPAIPMPAMDMTLWIVIAAAAVCIVAVIVLVIAKKKKAAK